jgi:hypothetical protein
MTRPRGFVPWSPRSKTRPKLDAVQAVLDQYSDYLPLTIRQIFYRLVGISVLGKSEKEYGALCDLLNRARRSHVIPMSSIRDDGFMGGLGIRIGWTDPQEFVDSTLDEARKYRKDRQAGQWRRLVIWCESAGMVPQVERVATDYGVTVKSSGGFDSTTVRHEVAEAWSGTTILHMGDYDPSGECMFDALDEDVRTFAEYYEQDTYFERIAVTPEHIARYELITSPPKPSTHQQRKRMTETVQLEAISPDDLASLVRDAIESRISLDQYRNVLAFEKNERAQLCERMADLRQ